MQIMKTTTNPTETKTMKTTKTEQDRRNYRDAAAEISRSNDAEAAVIEPFGGFGRLLFDDE